MLRSLVSSLVLLSFLLAGCAEDADVVRGEGGMLQLGGEEVRSVTERSVRLDGRTLVLDAAAGSMTIVGTEEEMAQLRFERVARGSSATTAQKRLDRMTIDEAGDGEIYQYFLRDSDGEGEFYVEARIPRTAALNIRLGNGQVRLSGTMGEVTVEGENGSIEAAGLAGQRVTLRTRRGNVAAGFAALPVEGRVRLATTNGNIDLTLPTGTDAVVDAETQTGTISVDGLSFSNRNLDRDGASQRFRGRLGQGRASIRATTEVGTIDLQAGSPRALDGITLDLFEPHDDTTIVPSGAPVAPTPSDQ